ncbi:potassium channel family protein [Halobacillus mangrovi]|uniref:Potassium channel protein n=1 Tax=Halobacillus mangrovi TaxID=402384 RepID=A0A1W5ZTW4_9BACI|nr:potassium channel family protein [Halobacillus mangrovi]ARI76718.1 potassium channel protein [Halobacillus mangrovi]
MQYWIRLYFQIPLFLRLLGTVMIMMTLFGGIIHILEPKSFPSLFDGIWWAFVTGATVGYGDYVPLSPAGKITAILLILTGGGLVTFYMATLSASTVKHEQALSKGEVDFRGSDHLVIIGWNERTRQLIDMIGSQDSPERIVLIDRSMNQFYQRLSNLHFVKGDATEESILEKANVRQARMAVVTADPSKKEEQSDQSVIHQVVALKGHHPDLFIIAEVLTDRQRINAGRAGADTVIRSNDFMSSLFYHELYRNDPIQPFEMLLDLLTARQFHEEKVPEQFEGEPLMKALEYFLKESCQIIGIKKGENVSFDLHAETKLEKGDYLIVFSPLRH